MAGDQQQEEAALWAFFWTYSPIITLLPQGPPCSECAREVLHFARKAVVLHKAGDMYFLRRIDEAQSTWRGCTTGVGTVDRGWHEL